MRTLQDRYNAVQEGNYSRSQFVRDSSMQLPNVISQTNSYDDVVRILKSKRMLSEDKQQETTQYEKPHAGIPLEAFDRAVDYELEAAGVDTATETPSTEQYNKAAEKANNNLDKDINHYLHLMSNDSNKVDKHDQLVQYSDKDKVDTINGLKKVDLKEIYNLSEQEDKMSKDEVINSFEENILPTIEKAEKGEIDVPMRRQEFNNYIDMLHSNGEISDELVDSITLPDRLEKVQEEEVPVDKRISADQASKIAKLANKVEPDASDKIQQLINFYQDQIPNHKVKKILNKYDLSQIKLKEAMTKQPLKEARRKRIQGGKAVKENDYDSGGYVDTMQPKLDDAVNRVLKVWNQWKNAPDTQPGMIPHAKKDLIEYFTNRLDLNVIEDQKANKDYDGDGQIETPEQEYLGSRDKAIKNNIKEQSVDQLKQMFKKKIVNILKENNQILSEAKTENLEEFLHYENEDNEDLAARIRKAAADLQDIIGSLEKSHIDVREKVESVYKNIGSFMAPAVEAAFKKDLQPVLNKLYNIQVPKGKRMSREEMEELGINPSSTTGTVFSLKEGKKRKKTKYTKRK